MLVKTRAILLKTIKYAENSVIARFYTEEFGLESFIINNIRAKKAAIHAGHLQPLALLELDIYQRSNTTLQRIKELRRQPLLPTLYSDMIKTSVVLFLQEVLNKVIIEKEKNTSLFNFLAGQLTYINQLVHLQAIYPCWCLLQLSKFLGFFPHIESWQPGYIFLPQQGVFTTHSLTEPMYFDAVMAEYTYMLCTTPQEQLGTINISPSHRKDLLDKLLLYYRLHIDGFGILKSHTILAEVLA